MLLGLNDMAKYVVERHLPGIKPDEFTATATRATETTAKMTEEGTPVRYLRSTFVPAEEKCYCLFEGPTEEAVREANKRAEIPFLNVTEARHIASEDLD